MASVLEFMCRPRLALGSSDPGSQLSAELGAALSSICRDVAHCSDSHAAVMDM